MDNQLNALERQLMRQKLLTVVVGVVAIIALTIALADRGSVFADEKDQEPVPRYPVLQAERFELVNDKGELLAGMSRHEKTGRPILSFLDEEGNSKLLLTLTRDFHPIISFQDKQDRQRMRMYLNEDFAGQVDMFDEKKNAQIEVEAGDYPHMYMRCGNPWARVLLDTSRSGSKLHLMGADGDNMAALGVDDEGSPMMELRDKNGESLFEAP